MTQGPLQRAPIPPSGSGVRGTIAAALGQGATVLIAANNPELVPFAAILGTAITGFLNGIGNLARNRVHSGGGFGWSVLGLIG